MNIQFSHQFMPSINTFFNTSNSNDKTSSFMNFIKKYDMSQEDQKLLFVILFATRFPINKDNLNSLIFDIFNNNKLSKIKPSQKELDDFFNNLLYTRNSSQNNYFNLSDTIDINLKELYSNFNGKLDSKMDEIIKDLSVKWNSLIIEDIYKINGKIKTTLLWQLKFGVSNNMLNLLQQEIANHKEDKHKLKKLEKLYDNQAHYISIMEKRMNDLEPSHLMGNNNYDLQLQLELELNRLIKDNQDLSQKYNKLYDKYNNSNESTYNILDEFEIIRNN